MKRCSIAVKDRLNRKTSEIKLLCTIKLIPIEFSSNAFWIGLENRCELLSFRRSVFETTKAFDNLRSVS